MWSRWDLISPYWDIGHDVLNSWLLLHLVLAGVVIVRVDEHLINEQDEAVSNQDQHERQRELLFKQRGYLVVQLRLCVLLGRHLNRLRNAVIELVLDRRRLVLLLRQDLVLDEDVHVIVGGRLRDDVYESDGQKHSAREGVRDAQDVLGVVQLLEFLREHA